MKSLHTIPFFVLSNLSLLLSGTPLRAQSLPELRYCRMQDSSPQTVYDALVPEEYRGFTGEYLLFGYAGHVIELRDLGERIVGNVYCYTYPVKKDRILTDKAKYLKSPFSLEAAQELFLRMKALDSLWNPADLEDHVPGLDGEEYDLLHATVNQCTVKSCWVPEALRDELPLKQDLLSFIAFLDAHDEIRQASHKFIRKLRPGTYSNGGMGYEVILR